VLKVALYHVLDLRARFGLFRSATVVALCDIDSGKGEGLGSRSWKWAVGHTSAADAGIKKFAQLTFESGNSIIL